METNKLTNKLSCEQVYNLWATEPYLIRILDMRSLEDFEEGHIPGAVHVKPENILIEFSTLDNKLAVIIAPEETELQIKKTALPYSCDYIFMNDCHRWSELKKPVAGDALNSILRNEKKSEGVDVMNEVIFYQLYEAESSTYTYIIADKKTKEAAIIDPVLETVERDLKLIAELELNLIYVLDTHIHADHITGADEIRKRTKAKTAVSKEAAMSCVDIPLEDGQELLLGHKKIKIIATPGHTNTCLTYYFEGIIFTGDALSIRGCGRTDFQQGSSDKLYDSVHAKLFRLPDETVVYPGHDYRGQTSSTVAMEKKYNPRLGIAITKEEFKKIMSDLKLASPKKIDIAVPANLACGVVKKPSVMRPQVVDGVPEVSCEDVFSNLGRVRLIDVRRPDEFNNELGHIQGAELITLGPDLTDFLEKTNRDEEIVFVCRSGARSGVAAVESIKLGYKHTINMVGGMIRWNELQQTIERN